MSMWRWLAVVMLVLGLPNYPAAPPPRVEPRLWSDDGVSEPPAAVSAAPAEILKLYLPIVTRGYAPGYHSPFGIVMYTTIDDNAGQAKMRAAGTYWYTTDLNWIDVEPNPPVGSTHTYTWASLDQDAASVNAAGGEIYVLVNRNPTWASAYPSGPVTNTANLVAFAAAAAERYDGDGNIDAPGHPKINYWSFYAEPDNGAEWAALQGKGYWGHDPTGYANMLKQVSLAVHAANPNAKVLIGGIAYDSFEGPPTNGPFVESFLGNTLAALGDAAATQYIDAIAFHYYPINTGRWASIREKGLEIRGIMNAHGVGQLELIVPEMGYWSDPGSGSSELQQAQTLVQMYVKGLSIGISHLDWFAPFDDGAGMETHGLFFNHNLNQPKQAYAAYRTLATTLYGLDFNRTASITGGEGYIFRAPGGREVTVVWATGASAVAHFPTGCLRTTDLFGNMSLIGDGGGGDQDGESGWIGLGLSQNNPVYVAACN